MEIISEIGIVDTRNLVKTLSDVYGLDLTNYALTSLKRRFERIISLHNIKSAESLITKLKNNTEYYDKFIKDFMVESTEMFRDPSLWRWLRDSFFPEIAKKNQRYKIWLPDCVSGDELFSLCIILKESGILNLVDITVTSINQLILDGIKTGITNNKKTEIAIDNFKRYNKFSDLTIYFTQDEQKTYRNLDLIKNIDFQVMSLRKDGLPRQIDMIIYRNRFIYYNQTLQDEITHKFMGSLKTGGIFIIGNKEQMGRQNANDFVLVNSSESVYKKR